MHGSNYMLPPCSLPNRCSPTCACGGYGSAGGSSRKPMTPFQQILLVSTTLVLGVTFAGGFYADFALKRRLAAQEAENRRLLVRR